jgi:lysophospholipase L1-like esterase
MGLPPRPRADAPPSPPLRRVLAVNLLVTVLLLAGVEGCVRVTHPEIGPAGMDAHLVAPDRFGRSAGLRPGARGHVYGAPVAVDEEGFLAYPTPPPEAPAWLLLGDSVTMGIGVAPGDTFAAKLAAVVDTVAVRNPSLIGYGAADYVAVLRGLLARPGLEVRRVTVVWCLNDAHAPSLGAANPDDTVRRTAGPALTFLRRHVRTFQWAKATFADRPRTYLLHDLPYYEGDRFAHAERQLGVLRVVADSAEIGLDLVLIPYEAQLRADADPALLLPQRRIAEAARDHGIPLLDVTDAFRRAERPPGLYRYGDGIHLSERGHALLAELVLGGL